MKRKLNNTIVKSAKPKEDGRPKSYTDGGGMYLLVNTKTKYWRYNYRFNKKQKTLALGVYPDVSLKEARIAHEEAWELLLREIDPSAYKQLQKNTQPLTSNHQLKAKDVSHQSH